eukprot:Gb_34899 [translate_table: standard]
MHVYAWELPGVTGNACNGLTPTVALQLVAVVYGANLFSMLLEDLEGCKHNREYQSREDGNNVEENSGLAPMTGGDNGKNRDVGRSGGTRHQEEVVDHRSKLMEDQSTDANSRRAVACTGGANLKFFYFRYKVNEDNAWPLASVWPGVRNPTVKV